MVLYLIGLGLGDEKDITVKGLERVRQCKYIFLESYTSILGVDRQKLVRTGHVHIASPIVSCLYASHSIDIPSGTIQ